MYKMSLLDFTEEEYYHNSVIQPPKDTKFLDTDQRFTRLVVDSRIRNKTLFPNPNDYEIQLEDDVNDCKSARLIYIDIPFPMYLINNNFNKLYFQVGSTTYTATIPQGDYSPTQLEAAITTAMNTQLPATFDVKYDSLLDNYNINATTAFTMLFNNQTNSLCYLLGFHPTKDYVSTADASTPLFPFRVKSEFRKNFDYNNYIIMDIEQFDVLKSIDRDLNRSFAMLPKNYMNMSVSDEANITKNFSPPLGRLTKLRVRFYDRFGNPYDFQNMDHRFELLITSFKQRRKYMH